MKKANKMILSLVFISVILASFFQITFPKPIVLKDNEISNENILSKPKSQASYQQFYDWDDANNMTIEANPDNNWTTTTIESDGIPFQVDSSKQSDLAGVSLNSSRDIISEGVIGKTVTYLEPIIFDGVELSTEVTHSDNRFFVYYTPAAWFYNATLEAKKNTVGNYLDNFNISSYEADGDIDLIEKINYEHNRADGYDLQYNLTKLYSDDYYFKVHLDYNETLNQFKWQETDFNHYIVNESGVYESNNMIDYSRVLEWNNPSLTFYGKDLINITSANNTILINYNNTYELLFTKKETEEISLMFTGLHKKVPMPGGPLWVANLSFYWFLDYLTLFSGSGDSYVVITVFLWDIVDVLYHFTWPLLELEVKFLITSVIIEWEWISIEIWQIEDTYLHWIILFNWLSWSFKIDYWFIISSGKFSDYTVLIQYSRLSKPDLFYFYQVPTYIMPNRLLIELIKSIYTDSTFYFTIRVLDLWGNQMDGCEINGKWGTYQIQVGDITPTGGGSGKYSLALPAKHVNQGDPAIWLNLTAHLGPYANGTLKTQIAVPKPKLSVNIIKERYNNETFEFVVEIINCTGDLIKGVSLSGKWDGIALTAPENITDNGDGTFNLNVTAKFVTAGAPGLWFNLTAIKTGYADGNLNTSIAVEPSSVPVVSFKKLGIDLVKQIYSEDWFNITFFVFNASNNQGITGLTFGTLLWNGTDVSGDSSEVIGEPGNYSISLEPITVDPTENLIKLSGSIDATGGFEQKDFVFYIGVDPEVIDKGVVTHGGIPAGDDDDEKGVEEKLIEPWIPISIGVGAASGIGAIGISIYLIKKKKLAKIGKSVEKKKVTAKKTPEGKELITKKISVEKTKGESIKAPEEKKAATTKKTVEEPKKEMAKKTQILEEEKK